MGKLALPVASSHGSVPSCKAFAALSNEKADPGEFIQCPPCQTHASIISLCLQASLILHLYCAKLDLALGS